MFAFNTGCRAKNYLQDSVCSLAHFRVDARGRQRKEPLRAASLGHRNVPWEPPQQVDSVKNLADCLSHSPSEIWPNIHFVFYPAVSDPKKRKRQATSDPDSETTSSLDSYSLSTVDPSESEDGNRETLSHRKLMTRISARAGQSESPGLTHSSMETTLAPKISQTTSTMRAPHFPSSRCSSTTPISGGSCAAKQTCEPSRSNNLSLLHTMPRILSL